MNRRDFARLLAIGGGMKSAIAIWDLEKDVLLPPFPCPGQVVCCLAFGPNGQLASAGTDQTVRVWDPIPGRLQPTLRGHTALVWGVAFSPDGGRLASVS